MPAPRQLRILLLEDHEETRDTLRRLFQRRGYRVQVARAIPEALRLARVEAFDVFVGDVDFANGENGELLTALRGTNPQVQAIAMSGDGAPADRARWREAGFGWHLLKPFEPEALFATLAEIAERSGSGDGQGN